MTEKQYRAALDIIEMFMDSQKTSDLETKAFDLLSELVEEHEAIHYFIGENK